MITLSAALVKTFGGIVSPVCFAVLRLITNANFIAASTQEVRVAVVGKAVVSNKTRIFPTIEFIPDFRLTPPGPSAKSHVRQPHP